MGIPIMKKLEQDVRLVRLLYFGKTAVKKEAEIFECSRQTIQNRRKRILEETG